MLRWQELRTLLDFQRLKEVLELVGRRDWGIRTGIPYDETVIRQLAELVDNLLKTLAQRERDLQLTIDACNLLFEANPMGIGIYDSQGRMVQVNRKMCELLGYTEEELAQLDPTHPEDREAGVQLFRELVEGKRDSYRREKRYIRKDGTVIWAELTAAALKDENGRTQFIVLMVQDITERKQMEQALRESEEQFRTIVESSHSLIGIHRGDKWIYVNPAAAEASGYSQEELLSLRFWEIVALEMQEQARQRGYDILQGKPVPLRNQIKVIKKTGEELWVDYTAVPIKLQGEPAILVVGHDITDLKRANEALERYNQRLQLLRRIDLAILEATPFEEILKETFPHLCRLIPCQFVSVGQVDQQQKELRMMLTLRVVGEEFFVGGHLSLEEEAIETLRSKEFVVCPDIEESELPTPLSEWLRSQGFQCAIVVPLRINGELYGVLILASEQKNAFTPEHREIAVEVGHQLAVALLQWQLREQVRHYTEGLEELVAQRTQELQEVNEELERFVATLAHDFRAPLTTIHGFAEMVLQDYGDRLDETGRDFLQRIMRSADQLSQLVTELRAYTRVRRSEMLLRPIELGSVVQVVLDHLAVVIKSRGARVEVVSPLPVVKGQEGLLIQVFQNLIANAVKFVPPDRTPQVRIWAEEVGEGVRVWVEDNGVGIPPEYRERIFRPFERLFQREFPGIGLGLAIARTAVERMGGAIGVESEVGKGSRFWVLLPRWDREGGKASSDLGTS